MSLLAVAFKLEYWDSVHFSPVLTPVSAWTWDVSLPTMDTLSHVQMTSKPRAAGNKCPLRRVAMRRGTKPFRSLNPM
jgi:hypothetical protein